MTYTDLRPDRTVPVWVEDGGKWHLGEVRAWRQRDDGSWQAWVSWYTIPGAGRIAWLDETAFRRGAFVD